ncbi:MAG: terminase, partial [Gemmatimonadota bacterium]
AVAFTECPWGSLLRHAERYSPFGVGFNKYHLFAAGGGPAIYLRQDLLARQQEHVNNLAGQGAHAFERRVWSFVTPFVPEYAPRVHRDRHWRGRAACDYTHEREWRVAHDFTFEYDQVEFVIVDSYEDVARFPRNLKDEIGRERFLIMEVYREIETLWPLHILE